MDSTRSPREQHPASRYRLVRLRLYRVTPGVTVDVRYGAGLVRHEQPLPYRSQFTLVLPQPLQAGQSYDCGVIVRLDPSVLRLKSVRDIG